MVDKNVSNFFEMLKFWVKQTDQNILDKNKRVPRTEISEKNEDESESLFVNPQFKREFVHYSNFNISISFFRSGRYRGKKINYVIARNDDELKSWYVKLLYNTFDTQTSDDKKSISVKYDSKNSNNKDPKLFKEYMKDYAEGKTYGLTDLDLNADEPNQNVIDLYNYFSEIVKKAKAGRKYFMSSRNYTDILKSSKNMILRGAPGTGKTFKAKQIATDLISNGQKNTYSELSDEEKAQVNFVQFHPSYDYSDFVEGLRPYTTEDQRVGFKLEDGIFRKFVDNARKQENQDKNYVFIIDEINRGEISKIFGELFFAIDPGYRGKEGSVLTQYTNLRKDNTDENNDYSFYIPENVYIIGTMNDIDRSVDSFDFAMRRRFRFVEVTATDSQAMLEDKFSGKQLTEIKKRMDSLNEAIKNIPSLNENYQIGAAYFIKLADEDISFEILWSDFLEPLLKDYVRGMYEEQEILQTFKKAYNNTSNESDDDIEDEDIKG